MELSTAIDLIKGGVYDSETPQRWADLGAGDGLFTRALSGLVPQGSIITAVDINESALQSVTIEKGVHLETIVGDFSKRLSLPGQDGIIMANSLHYIREQEEFLSTLKAWLLPNGRLIIVEYDSNKSNPWVPFPLPFAALEQKVISAGFLTPRRIGEVSSKFRQGNIYAAVIAR